MKPSHKVWVLLLSNNAQNKMTENTNVQSSVYESFNNKWTGCIFVPFLLQISRIETMIFLGLNISSPRG